MKLLTRALVLMVICPEVISPQALEVQRYQVPDAIAGDHDAREKCCISCCCCIALVYVISYVIDRFIHPQLGYLHISDSLSNYSATII